MFVLFKVRDLRAKLSGKLNGGGFGGVHIMDNNRCGATRMVSDVPTYGATFIIRNPFREKVKSIEVVLVHHLPHLIHLFLVRGKKA